MSDDKRPSWPHKIPEDIARWLYANRVTAITYHWKMTGDDTSESWLQFHSRSKRKKIPTRFASEWPEIEFRPDHAGLISFTSYPDARKTIEEIDAWEKKNAHELEEYKRLCKKFRSRKS